MKMMVKSEVKRPHTVHFHHSSVPVLLVAETSETITQPELLRQLRQHERNRPLKSKSKPESLHSISGSGFRSRRT